MCVVNTVVIKNSRQITSLPGRAVGVGRNCWGRVRTEFEIVRGEHRPSTISNSVWIRLVNLTSLVTRSKNENQRVVKVCEKWTGSRNLNHEPLSVRNLARRGKSRFYDGWRGVGLIPTSLNRGLSITYCHDRGTCDIGHAMGWRSGNRCNLRFYDDWAHDQPDSDPGRACATVR